MTAEVKLPEHAIFEEEGSRTTNVGDWSIIATTKTIVSASESDSLQKTLGFPLPEMTFGNNALELRHKKSDWVYKFSTEDALRCVKNGELGAGDGGVKVEYADAWLKSR